MKILPEDIFFVKELFSCFEKENIAFCILRNSDELMHGDTHDIDMTINFERCEDMILLIKKISSMNGWKIHYFSEKDNGNLLAIHLYKIVDGKPVLIHFDFFREFGWKGYKLISNKLLLSNRKKNGWLYEADLAVQAVTMLFSRYLYHGYIKEKYRTFIHLIFKNQVPEVEKIMMEFLPTEFTKCIIEDVISANWENIEQERTVVIKAIKNRLSNSQKYVNQKILLFNIKRIRKCTGAAVVVRGGKNYLEYNDYAMQIQKILERTFSREDVVELYSNLGGGANAIFSLG